MNLPEDSLSYAHRIQAEASAEGFDWDHVDGVLAKVEEELGEIREALQRQDVAHARRELGDLMLVTVHLARFLDADSASELTRAARRFQFRYAQLKISLEREGKKLKTCDSAELERHWQRAKPVADKLLTKGLDMHPEDGANSSSVF